MKDEKDPSIFQIIGSILSSFLGVQNKENFERDEAFIEKKGLKPYVIAGFAMAIFFVLLLYGIVKIIMANVA